jgi:hypothetical protein
MLGFIKILSCSIVNDCTSNKYEAPRIKYLNKLKYTNRALFWANISDYYSTVFARILVFKTVEKLISELPSKTQIKSFEENSIYSDLASIIYF